MIVWAARGGCPSVVRAAVRSCGAACRRVRSLSAIEAVQYGSRCGVAIVLPERGPVPGPTGLSAVRRLKRRGLRVLCCQEGAASWSLSLQCKVLLAGAVKLLDVSTPQFSRELESALAGLLRLEAGKAAEEEDLTRTMRRLGVVGESPAMLGIFRRIIRISKLSDLPVLITGETGTGKELLAQAIHRLDEKRSRGPFVPVNCAAISSDLAESELFGHRRGAFTGAAEGRRGLFRSADRGVLFLDEIGELNDGLQVKLLRTLQESRVRGVGDDREADVDVRVVAATNRELDRMVEQGNMRTDLFHRLAVLPVHIPPLRERPEDLRPLTEEFLRRYRSLRPRAVLSAHERFVGALRLIDLPGNARQLENFVRRALVARDDDTPLDLEDLPREVWERVAERQPGHARTPEAAAQARDLDREAFRRAPDELRSSLDSLLDAHGWGLARCLDHCEKLLLETALSRSRGNRSQAAQTLGVTSRTIYNKLHKHQIRV